jgi:hypothetical protein
MKKVFLIFMFAALIANVVIAQDLSNILQTYYLTKPDHLLETTIAFVNSPQVESEMQFMFLGFYGALFSVDTMARNEFRANLERIEQDDIREYFRRLLTFNIDSLYEEAKYSALYNDLNWASFFATGHLKYIDNILKVAEHDSERKDLNLYLAGSSAKWSLCSNALQDKNVKQYLVSIKCTNPLIKNILSKKPEQHYNETVKVLKTQKKKGVWQ